MLFEESEFNRLSTEDIYELLKYYPTNQLVSWLNHKVLNIPPGALSSPVGLDMKVKIYNPTLKNCNFNKVADK